MAWRCVADDPIGVAIPGVSELARKPVCHIHGTKACVIKRAVHHVDGCRKSQFVEYVSPRTPSEEKRCKVDPTLERYNTGRPFGTFVRRLGPRPYCVTDESLVTCSNCLARLARREESGKEVR